MRRLWIAAFASVVVLCLLALAHALLSPFCAHTSLKHYSLCDVHSVRWVGKAKDSSAPDSVDVFAIEGSTGAKVIACRGYIFDTPGPCQLPAFNRTRGNSERPMCGVT